MTRIAEVLVEETSVPLHTPFVTAARRATTLETVTLRLVDDDGLVGWGEGPQSWRVTGESIGGIRACLEGPLREVLVGAELGEIDAVVASVQAAVVANPSAKMAADIALHDLAARQAGVPLATWLGAASGALSLPTDVTLSAGRPAELVATARARVAQGFSTLKLKVGTDAADDADRVLAVREAVGPGVVLRLDANQGWSVADAVSVITALERAEAGIELVEQPVRRRDRAGLAAVAAAVHTPVLADESVFDLDDLEEVAALGHVRAVNIKLAKCGGLGPARALVQRATELGLDVVFGSMMEGSVGIAAVAALALASGGGRVHDLDAAWWLAHPTVEGGPVYVGDRVMLPAAPGLGPLRSPVPPSARRG